MIDDNWTTIALRLGVATAIGLALGFEREWRGRDAGLRTHALVALSSATITVSALMMSEVALARGSESDPVRVVQGLAQAIGFIAGGLIFIRGGDVRNMTSAASLWMSAAVGIAAGAGQFLVVGMAAAAALLVLTSLSLLKRLMPERDEEADDQEGARANRRAKWIEDETAG
ncbi:magnesium transporter MgtC [Nostoc sp. 3335mG]|nr:magnesium transporter MgtC [Nostoc sp. 3335mG]